MVKENTWEIKPKIVKRASPGETIEVIMPFRYPTETGTFDTFVELCYGDEETPIRPTILVSIVSENAETRAMDPSYLKEAASSKKDNAWEMLGQSLKQS